MLTGKIMGHDLLSSPVFHRVTVILGDPQIRDLVKPGGMFAEKEFEELDTLKQALESLTAYEFTYLDNHATLLDDLRRDPPDFVLNFCDNGFANDPLKELHIPACLEMLGIPYSGADPRCLALSYNKMLVNALARAGGIATPDEMLFSGDWGLLDGWSTFPAMIKPNAADNSFGISGQSVVHDRVGLKAQVSHLFNGIGVRDILVQEFLSGTEYTVLMIGNPNTGFTFLPVFQWDFADLKPGMPAIQTHAMKYDKTSPDYELTTSYHATFDMEKEAQIQNLSAQIFERIGCRDFAKVDWREDAAGMLKLVEFNPNPSWDKDALIAPQDEKKGYFYPDILRLLIETGQLRYLSATLVDNRISL
jgi:D-alanine-D-alanine ligase